MLCGFLTGYAENAPDDVRPGTFAALWALADEVDRGKYWAYKGMDPSKQVINHHPGIRHLGNKNLLNKNLRKAVRKFGAAIYDFVAPSFLLPRETIAFKAALVEEEARRAKNKGLPPPVFIVKGAATDRGLGLLVVSGSADVDRAVKQLKRDGAVAQRYVTRPYLLHASPATTPGRQAARDAVAGRGMAARTAAGARQHLPGHKFTLRLYVVLRSFDPTRAYLYREGLVHIASVPYKHGPAHLANRVMQLTNPDIGGRLNPSYKKNPRPYYWRLTEVMAYVDEMHKLLADGDHNKANRRKQKAKGDDPDGDGPTLFAVPPIEVWRRIHALVHKTVLAVEPGFVRREYDLGFNGPNLPCFELLGFDVLLDAKLRPWLLEINPDPDMSAKRTFPLASTVKEQMLDDTLRLVGLREAPARGARAALLSRALLAFAAAGKKRAPIPARLWELYGGNATAPEARLCPATGRGLAWACPLAEEGEALMLARAEIEHAQRGAYDRVPAATAFPFEDGGDAEGGHDTLIIAKLSLFPDGPRRSDTLLACWAASMNACGLRSLQTPAAGVAEMHRMATGADSGLIPGN